MPLVKRYLMTHPYLLQLVVPLVGDKRHGSMICAIPGRKKSRRCQKNSVFSSKAVHRLVVNQVLSLMKKRTTAQTG